MSYKEKIEYYIKRFKRPFLTSVLCVLAFALIIGVAVKSNSNLQIENNGEVQTSNPTSVSFIMPVKDGAIIKDFSNSALKFNSTLKQWEAHKAVDIKGSDSANVMAVLGGEVVSVETTYLKGTVVTIKHTDSLQTVYGSLDDVSVSVGDSIKQGTIIGKTSTTAKGESADGDHLHFEVLVDNVKVDPNLYLINSQK